MFLCVCPKKRRTEDTAIHWWNEGLEKCWKPQNFQYSPDMWGVVGVGLESLVRWSRSAKLGRDSMTMHFKFLQCLQYCSLTLQIGIAVFQEQVHLHIHIYSYYIYICTYIHLYLYIFRCWIIQPTMFTKGCSTCGFDPMRFPIHPWPWLPSLPLMFDSQIWFHVTHAIVNMFNQGYTTNRCGLHGVGWTFLGRCWFFGWKTCCDMLWPR